MFDWIQYVKSGPTKFLTSKQALRVGGELENDYNISQMRGYGVMGRMNGTGCVSQGKKQLDPHR